MGESNIGPPRTGRYERATIEFEFGAAFTPVRSLRLGPCGDRPTTVADLLPTAAGEFWVADAAGGTLKIYSPEGNGLRVLDRTDTGLSRPVSLAPLYGRWVIALDGRKPRVTILDESGRSQRRFLVPEVDMAMQVRTVADEWIAIAGTGWGAGAGRLLHIYTPDGHYVESLFGAPRARRPRGRVHLAVHGSALYFGQSRADSFGIYDLRLHTVLSFPSVAVSGRRARAWRGRSDPAAGFRGGLAGLFATTCGELLAMYGGLEEGDHFYDLYALSGEPVALALRARERILALEGPFYFSVDAARPGDLTLRIWKLRYPAGAAAAEREGAAGAGGEVPPAPRGAPGS